MLLWRGGASLTVGLAYLDFTPWVIYFFFFILKMLSLVCSETSPTVMTVLEEFGFH